MGIESFIESMKRRFTEQIAATSALNPCAGEFENFPPQLHVKLVEALRASGIHNLYSHQSEAFEAIAKGEDTVLVSRTASGKTLSFLLPILNAYLNADAPFGVMLLYPTKALSRDQEGALGKLLQAANADLRLGTFDGDTPREERTRIQSQADFVISNPDMLHAGILPNHNRRWRTFLSRLRYVVIDEVHTYRGILGAHVACVLRRLPSTRLLRGIRSGAQSHHIPFASQPCLRACGND